MYNLTIRPPDPTPRSLPRRPVDLKSFVRNLASRPPSAKPTAGQHRRVTALVESGPRRISAPPAPVVGFADGIQRRCLAGRIQQRDVTLVYVAAGVASGRTLLSVQERLAVLCSALDEEQVRTAGPDVPVVALPELFPWDLAVSVDGWLDGTRRALELDAVNTAPAEPGHVVVVDGSLPATSSRPDLVSVVKSTETDWLPDPSLLPDRAGWRSPALRLPATRAGERDRLTAYVRLRTAGSEHAWSFSLIRVEVYEDTGGIDLLDAAAAMAMTQRQPLACDDPRAETHLLGIRRAEECLRARAPFAIDVLGR